MVWVLIRAINSLSLNSGVCQRYLIINNQRIPLSLQQWSDDPPALCHRLEDFALRHSSYFSRQFSVPSEALNDSARGLILLTQNRQHDTSLHPPIKILQTAAQCLDPTPSTQPHTTSGYSREPRRGRNCLG